MDGISLAMRVARALLAITLVFSLWAALATGQARAATAYAMPVYGLSLANGSTLGLKPSEGSTELFLTTEDSSYWNLVAGMTFEVATANVGGGDSTLSDDYNIDYDFAQQADGFSNRFKFRIHNFRFLTAGTYYFQFSGYNVYGQHLVSPVFYFVFDPNAGGLDLTIKRAQATSYMRYLIKANSKHAAKHLRATCDPVNYTSLSCYAHFNAGAKTYQGKFVVANIDLGDGKLYFTAKFKGEAARFSCLRRSSRAACSKTVKWHT